MRAFTAVICLLCLFRFLATISAWVNLHAIDRRKPGSPQQFAIRAVILLLLFVWGSWALWSRS